MAPAVGFENTKKPCEIEAWRVARTQIDAQGFVMLWHEGAEVFAKWPTLSPQLRAGIIAIIHSSK